MKPDPGAEMPGDRAMMEKVGSTTGMRPHRSPIRLAATVLGEALALVLATLLIMVAAALAALLIVRVGADLLQGIDPLAREAQRPRLYPQQVALREVASDVLRQVLLAAIVIAVTAWRDGPSWPRTLALVRVEAPGLLPARLLLILLVWPFLHILWVIGTADAFHMNFGRNVGLSPMLGSTGAVGWLLFTIILAPVAEELLMRGAMFAKALRFMRPSGAVLATSALFVMLHLQIGSIARPVSLIPLALMLGWLRWRTGRLWPCMVLHIWSNLAVVTYLLWPATG